MKNKIPYIIILGIILILAIAYGVKSYMAGSAGGNVVIEPTGETKSFVITAKKFSFTPDQITVNRGDNVKLSLTSADVVHGFKLDGYGINKTLNPGETVTVEFIADKPGTFEFRCSIPCGEGHIVMKGTLAVK
jgi:heme/copper-type cytochrome/quinol oxidase subunit 2